MKENKKSERLARIGVIRNAEEVFVRKSKQKAQLGRHDLRWKFSIKLDF